MFSYLYANKGIIAAIFFGVLVAFQLLRMLLKKLGITLPSSARMWQSYLREQGTILFCFLLLGWGLGWLSINYGQERKQITNDGRLLEYRQLDISDHPVYQDLDLEGFTHLTIYAKSLAPQSSKISVRVIPEEGKTTVQSVSLEGSDSSWVRLEEPISSKRATLVVGGIQSGLTKATQADVLVFLSKP